MVEMLKQSDIKTDSVFSYIRGKWLGTANIMIANNIVDVVSGDGDRASRNSELEEKARRGLIDYVYGDVLADVRAIRDKAEYSHTIGGKEALVKAIEELERKLSPQ